MNTSDSRSSPAYCIQPVSVEVGVFPGFCGVLSLGGVTGSFFGSDFGVANTSYSYTGISLPFSYMALGSEIRKGGMASYPGAASGWVTSHRPREMS